MRRIGIITPDISQDWASTQLLQAANRRAEGVPVDPLTFEVRADGRPAIRIQGEPAESFDALIVRGFNRQGEIDYQYEIFELLEQQGCIVVNSPAGLSLAESKSQTTFCLQQAGLPTPRTYVAQSVDDAADAVRMFGVSVIKPLYGSYGIGIERLGPEIDYELLGAFMDRHGVIYVQEYLPNEGRDIRAFVVGDEIPAAMYRIANEGQWKTNVFQGGRCELCELSPVVRDLCLRATEIVGLEYTGVDVMMGPQGPMILELNGAPSWHGLSEVTTRDVALDLVDHVLYLLEEGRSARRPAGLTHLQRTAWHHSTEDQAGSVYTSSP